MSNCSYCGHRSHSSCTSKFGFNPISHCRHCHSHNDCHHMSSHCGCSRNICSDDFRLRLGGLQNGMNFRLRQLIGCIVKLELNGGKKIEAEICLVGSNYVEVKVLSEEKKHTHSEGNDEEFTETTIEKNEKKLRNCRSWIFPTDQINHIELNSRCNCGKRH